MIIPGLLVALFTYASHGQVDWLAGLSMALGSVFLVPYGVRLAYALPEPRLKLTFACMLLVIMVLLLLKARSEEHTSELQSLMRKSYAAFCLKQKTNTYT